MPIDDNDKHRGEQGIQGETGERGETGKTGATGEAGAMGERGLQGEPGTSPEELQHLLTIMPDEESRESLQRLWLQVVEYATTNANNIRKLIKVTSWALVLIAAVTAAVGVLSIRITIDQGNQRTEFDRSIQRSRVEASYNACLETNARNQHTVSDIKTLVSTPSPGSKPLPPSVKKAQIIAIDKLANDLAPFRSDCQTYAKNHNQLQPK